MHIRFQSIVLLVFFVIPLKGWAPTEELFGNYHFKVHTSRDFKQAYQVELSGTRSANTQYIWSIDPESKGTLIFSPNSQPVVTEEPYLDIVLSGPGVVNLQVLFTSPGERVVGTAARILLGTKDARPKPEMTALYAIPEVGDEVLVNLSAAKGSGYLGFVTDFGDAGKQLSGARVQHSYNKAGPYRITSTATDRKGRAASVFLDIEVSSNPVLANPCTPIQGASSAFRCEDSMDYAVCMIFLRESTGDYTCEDMSNPLNDADKLAGGAPGIMQSCSISPDFLPGGWRCFTDPALTQCRRYLVGHQHLPADTIRQCLFEDQPDKITKLTTATVDAVLDPSAYYGAAFTVQDGSVDIAYNNPGPKPLTQPCSENIANYFGETCARSCGESWYSLIMEPLAQEIPVIQGLSCSTSFHIGTLVGIGDTYPRVAASCQALMQSAPPDSKITFSTTIWMSTIGHYMWNNPATGGTANNRWYSNELKDSPTSATPLAIPALVNCIN